MTPDDRARLKALRPVGPPDERAVRYATRRARKRLAEVIRLLFALILGAVVGARLVGATGSSGAVPIVIDPPGAVCVELGIDNQTGEAAAVVLRISGRAPEVGRVLQLEDPVGALFPGVLSSGEGLDEEVSR